MAKLKPGALTIDLTTGGIYGDLVHCPKEDLLESAQALVSLLPQVQHQGIWGLGKAYDADCYIWTSAKGYPPPEGLTLEQNISRGIAGTPPQRPPRPFRLVVFSKTDRDKHFEGLYYEPLVGSIVDGHATDLTEGIPDLTASARAKQESEEAAYQAKRAEILANNTKRAKVQATPAEARPNKQGPADGLGPATQKSLF